MKKTLSFFILFALSLSVALAQQTSTVMVFSKAMQKEIANDIVLPADYSVEKTYPVLYLLHGYGGKNTTWPNMKKSLTEEATKYGMIFVCPDGANSWYWDSPVNENMKYDTYVSKELVEYVDANYSTIKSAKGRAVTGLSMGGHGGLWLGINHPDIFGGCGSMSGGVDIRPFPNNWEMNKWIGKQKDQKENWDNYTIINQLYKIEPNSLEIIIDCGYEDFFFHVNEKLHEEMLYLNIKHDYYTRPGGHTGEYWANAIDYQLVFFNKFFKK